MGVQTSRRRRRRATTAALISFAALMASSGTTAREPTHHAGAVPAAARDVEFSVVRLGGSTAAATAARISRRFFSPGVPAAFVVSSDMAKDSLSTGPAAAKIGAPVLFATRSAIPEATATELDRLEPDRIYVVGDTDSISDAVLLQLAPLSGDGATRISAHNRYGTAARLSERFFPSASTVYVANGNDFHNPIASGPAAAVQHAPMLLVARDSLPERTADELARLGPDRIMLIGSTGSVSSAVAQALGAFGPVERVAGDGVVATAVAVSKRVFGTDRPATFLATAAAFPDAATAVSPAGRTRGPILWVSRSTMTNGTRNELVRLSPRTAYVLGGSSAVSNAIVKTAQRLLGVCWSGDKPPVGSQQLITTVPSATKHVALTFDMGGRLTPARDIVAYLAANQVCSTIFPTGAMAQTTEGQAVMADLARRPELFEFGNHTMHHCNLVTGGGGSPTSAPCEVQMTGEFIRSELTSAHTIIRSLSNSGPRPYWRPPYSAFNSFVLGNAAAVGYPMTIQFNRDTIDWDPDTTTSQIIARATSPLPPDGSIVLFHLGGFRTLDALPWIVTYLRDHGYTLTTVSDMLG